MNLLNYIKNKKNFAHFSVDDVFEIFDKNSQNFKYLKYLYDKWGIVSSLYVFSEPEGKRFLDKVPTNHLKSCSWLKFGPHAPDWDHPLNTLTVKEQLAHLDYMYKQLIRIVGKKNLADNVRLHAYKGSKEACINLAQRGVKTLFTQNYWDERVSYCLPPNSRNILNNRGWYKEPGLNINFIKTDIGLEFRNDVKKDVLGCVRHHNFVVFFTHEKDLTDKKTQQKIESVLSICQEKNIKFVH